MHPEPLLVFTTRDVRERFARRHPYELIRIGGLLRQILLDATPLLTKANRETRIKIRFPVADRGVWGGPEPHNGESALLETTIIPPDDDEGDVVRLISIKEFLALPLFRVGAQAFTVRDVIQQAAHVQGGVHSGIPQDEREKLQYTASYRHGFSMPAYQTAMIQIVLVVLKALAPLEQALAKKWGIGPTQEPLYTAEGAQK